MPIGITVELNRTGRTVLIGTDDPMTTPETVDNYYTQELGHVLGAIHPSDTDGDGTRFEVPSDAGGVMCKDECAEGLDNELLAEAIERSIREGTILDLEVRSTETEWIRNSMSFSEENRKRILEIDYDHRDGDPDDKFDEPPLVDTVNERRNLKTVATAASTDPPDENIDIDE